MKSARGRNLSGVLFPVVLLPGGEPREGVGSALPTAILTDSSLGFVVFCPHSVRAQHHPRVIPAPCGYHVVGIFPLPATLVPRTDTQWMFAE